MTYSPPEDRPGWRTAPSDGTSSHDAIPPHTPEGGGRRAALLAAVGGVVALVVVAGVMLAPAGGDGDGGGVVDGGGADVGGALATARTVGHVVDELAIALPLLALALLGLGVAVAPDRLRALGWVGAGVAGGAAMTRPKGEGGTVNVGEANRHMRSIRGEIKPNQGDGFTLGQDIGLDHITGRNQRTILE